MKELSKKTKIFLSVFALIFVILILTQFIWPVRVSFDSEKTRQYYEEAEGLEYSCKMLKEQGDPYEELLSDYPFEFSDDEEYRTIFVYFNVKNYYLGIIENPEIKVRNLPRDNSDFVMRSNNAVGETFKLGEDFYVPLRITVKTDGLTNEEIAEKIKSLDLELEYSRRYLDLPPKTFKVTIPDNFELPSEIRE